MTELAITYLPVAELRPFARNARSHSRKQIRQIADSIQAFGFTSPVLVDDVGTILAGHGRIEAAKLVGMAQVPCVRLASMTPEQKRAYVLADNKLALNAAWDDELLALELQHLMTLDLDFDVGVTGFTVAETDLLIEGLQPEEASDPRDERLPTLRTDEDRVRPGDLWALGPHRLLCGSALDATSYARLMAGERAQMVFTDPPYNVPIQGHVGGSGAIRHREFAMASGEMTEEAFTDFLRTAFVHLVQYSQNGSIHLVCMDWRHMDEMLQAGSDTYSELKNLIVWVKTNGGMGTFYRSRHELVFAFKSGTEPHVNSFELGQHGRNRTNVWEYAGANSFKAGRMEELELHPTVKPVALVADAIKDVSARGGLVLDPFGGSGSTLIAAHKTGRRARLIELDPVYCDRILRRWEVHAKDDAVLLAREREPVGDLDDDARRDDASSATTREDQARATSSVGGEG
ncbi:site-specific DNA-methyltransferase [Methylobacterium sp. J-026]|uniref:site-specific DNA-methyltransferase n=1 Tax=Methylobacterium sp. J-026 TaxID=2836624 RepID=UPI001FBB1100|nr:DNA methyltransferase [Methylobacterium sp. J-026]MCJ2135092.1 site-specific DNA-methyltransferase [Methylobacterium sp. J-026]